MNILRTFSESHKGRLLEEQVSNFEFILMSQKVTVKNDRETKFFIKMNKRKVAPKSIGIYNHFSMTFFRHLKVCSE